MKIEAALEKKRDLEKKIKSAESVLANMPRHIPMGMSLYEWNSRLENLMHKHKNDLERVTQRDSAYYHQIQDNIEKISFETEQRQDLERKTRAELDRLKKELDTLDLAISMQELLALQGKAATLQETIDGLNLVVEFEKEKIDAIEHKNTVTLAALLEERGNLLADIASGVHIEKGQVEKLDKDIAEERAEYKKSADAISTASQTIAGLSRKIAKVEKELSLAKSNFNDAAASFLRGEISKAGATYADLAGRLANEFTRIVSMASICEKLGDPVNVFGPYSYKFQIPSFSPDVCKAQECSDMAGMLFRFTAVNRPEAIKKELDYFASLGLTLTV